MDELKRDFKLITFKSLFFTKNIFEELCYNLIDCRTIFFDE